MLFSKLLSATAVAAPIEFVGTKTTSSSGTGISLSVALNGLTNGSGSDPQEGDLILLFTEEAYNADRSIAVTGFTEIADLYANDIHDANFWAGYMVAAASPPTSVSVTKNLTSSMVAMVFVFRNVSTTTPIDVTSTTATASNTLLVNPPSITPVTNGAWIICAGGATYNTHNAAAFISSDLDQFRTAYAFGNSTADSLMGVGYKLWSGGAFNAAAFTSTENDSTNYANASVSIAIRPKLFG